MANHEIPAQSILCMKLIAEKAEYAQAEYELVI